MKKLLLYCVLIAIIWPLSGMAFDNDATHRDLTFEAIINSKLSAPTANFLKDNLGLISGTTTIINNQSIVEWLRYGSFKEDEPLFRASSHFHNPLRNWDKSGVRDLPLVFKLACIAAGYPPTSNIQWATGYVSPEMKHSTANAWDWDRARENYYIYLTGMDFDGNVVASSKQARESFLADSLRSLGQVLHLLQDMAVPAHVRDDFMSHRDAYGTDQNQYYKYVLTSSKQRRV